MFHTYAGQVKIEQARTAGRAVVENIKNLSGKSTIAAQVAIAAFSDSGVRTKDLTIDYAAAR